MGVMHAISRRGRAGRRLLASEAGFALIEVMVSAVLVVILAMATLSIIETSGQASSDNRSRGIATQLAQQDQDSMRLMDITDLSGYHVTHPEQTVGGGSIKFTVKSDADFVRDVSGKVDCSPNSTRAEYVKITSSVTWTNHPRPVILESYVSPGVKGLEYGSLTVKLHTDAGVGVGGIPVSYRGTTVTTDASGCAVFTTLTPGASNATWSGLSALPPYVNRNGSTSVVQPVTIGSGQNSQVDQLWDQAGKVPVNFVDEAGNATRWNTIAASNSGITSPSSGIRTWSDTTSNPMPTQMTTGDLFPFLAKYQIFAGSCAGNAPTTYDTGATSANLGKIQVTAGTTMPAINSTVPNVYILATDGGSTGNTPISKGVSLTPSSDSRMSGCADGYKMSAGKATDSAGKLQVPLPYGIYDACMTLVNGSTTRYLHRTVRNTPATATASADATTHDINLAAPLDKATTVLLNAKQTQAAGTYGTAPNQYTVNSTPCA